MLGVGQESSHGHGFARKLASSDKKTREKGVALLVLWLTCQREIEEDELKKIWKGLFYCVWHADKAPVQAELIERLASLLEKLDVDVSVLFFKVFLSTMRREWSGIDRLRLDKFYLLLRKFLVHMFKVLEKEQWRTETVRIFMNALEERAFLAHDRYPALGINLHFTDIFLDEFRKFLPVPAGTLRLMLEPFYSTLVKASDKSLLKRVRERIFDYLLTDARYTVRSADSKEKAVEKSGNLSYLLQSTPVASRLFELASSPTTLVNRRILYELHDEFSKISKLLVTIENTAENGEGIDERPIRSVVRSCSVSEAHPLSKLVRTSIDPINSPLAGRIKKKRRRSKKSAQVVTVPESLTDSVESQQGLVAVLPSLSNGVMDDISKKSKATKVSIKTKRLTAPLGPSPQSASPKRSSKKEKSLPQPSAFSEGVFKSTGTGEGLKLGSFTTSNGCCDEDMAVDTVGKQERASVSSFQLMPGSLKRKAARVSQTTTSLDLAENAKRDGGLQVRLDFLTSEDTVVQTPVKKIKRVGLESFHVEDTSPQTPSKKVKKVRFALKNNIVWKPQGPLPPLCLRTPPSATPRGSALKVGVVPGPIRTRPLRMSRGSGMLRTRKRTSKQYLSTSLQKTTRTLRSKSKGL